MNRFLWTGSAFLDYPQGVMTRKSKIKSLPPQAGRGKGVRSAPATKAGDMRMSYEFWAVERLRKKETCKVERTMSCIPLRDDPICGACYEGEKAATEHTEVNKC